MSNIRLSRALCAAVAEALPLASHAIFDEVFLIAGAPAPPPNLPHSYKWKEWLFKAGLDPNVDSLSVLGNILEESMDIAPTDDAEAIARWKTKRARVIQALEEDGFRYFRGGRVLPTGQMPEQEQPLSGVSTRGG